MTARRRGRRRAWVGVCVCAALLPVLDAAGQEPGAPFLTMGVEVADATGEQAVYAFTVTNHGDAAASGVRVSHAVPEHTSFVTATPAPTGAACVAGGTQEPAGTECEWELTGSIPAGGSRTIEVTLALGPIELGPSSDEYAVDARAAVTEPEADEDADTSLRKRAVLMARDAWVDAAEPADTNHGGCSELWVAKPATTTFLAPGTLDPGFGMAMERLYDARLRVVVKATSYAAGTPGTLAAHEISDDDPWTEGSGGCPPAQSKGSGAQVRTGFTPAVAAESTDTASVTGPGDVELDVVADLDSADERAANDGWQLRDASGGGPPATPTVLHDDTAGPDVAGRVFVVYTVPEAPTCVDARPEATASAADVEPGLEAFLTDGVRVTREDRTACNGSPVAAGSRVEWQLEDDDPDTYVSRRNGEPTTLQPNATITTVDEDGRTTIAVRAADPAATGEARIAARVEDAAQPESCPPPGSCPGESDGEDDATVEWTGPSPPPPPTSSDSTSGTGGSSGGSTSATSGSSGGSGSGTSGGSGTGSSGGGATSGSGTGTGAGTGTSGSGAGTGSGATGSAGGPVTTTALPSGRGVTGAPRRARLVAGDEIAVSGRVRSADAACVSGHAVQLVRRADSRGAFVPVARAATGPDGAFALRVVAGRSGEYALAVPAGDRCDAALSAPFAIRVRARVTAQASALRVARGRRVRITGEVTPAHPGTRVALQRRGRGRWVAVGRRRLDRRSRFGFSVRGTWRGVRSSRVRWSAPGTGNDPGTARVTVAVGR